MRHTALTALAVAMGLTLSLPSSAADYRDNPFTLCYDGAITENVVGKVNIRPVTYELNGIIISANVYINGPRKGGDQ